MLANLPTISIIDPLGKHGGHHYYVDGTATGLSANGFNAHVYVTAFTGISPKKPFRQYVAFGELYGEENALVRGMRYAYGLVKSLWLSRRAGARVVNLHAFRHDLRELAAIWGSRLVGMKVILTIHDIESFGSSRSGLIRKVCLSGASALVFQNAFSQATFERLSGLSGKPVAVIPHGHYVDAYPTPPSRQEARDRLELDNDEFILLFFGNPRKEKGLNLLVRALAMLSSKPGWRLVVAGKMRREQEEGFRAFIQQIGIGDRVRIDAGHVPDDKTPDYYRAANLVVMPYHQIYESGVAIMSMSMARAALVSDLEPLTEKIIDGVTGLVFPEGDESALAASLLEAVESRAELDALGAAGLAQVLQSRAWHQIGALLGQLACDVTGTETIDFTPNTRP